MFLQHCTVTGFFLHQAADGGNSQLHDFKIGLFVVTAYVVDFAFHTLADNQVDSFAVVFHVEPVTHVTAVAIDGEVLAFENILDDKRNQLFREVIRTVVVGAAADSYRHFISVAVSHHNQVGTGL